MKNIDLNPGGLIGALACAGIYAAIVFPSVDIFSSVDITKTGYWPYKLMVFALIGGAFAGNFLWGLFFKPRLPKCRECGRAANGRMTVFDHDSREPESFYLCEDHARQHYEQVKQRPVPGP
jgi:hypothetical protein